VEGDVWQECVRAKLLKALEDENAKLKQLLADQMLEAATNEASVKKMQGNAHELSRLNVASGSSKRRTCSIVGGPEDRAFADSNCWR
jgi:hypothetical protein